MQYKFYWAKKTKESAAEIVRQSIYGEDKFFDTTTIASPFSAMDRYWKKSDFYWMSETPIEEVKIPIQFGYYIVKYKDGPEQLAYYSKGWLLCGSSSVFKNDQFNIIGGPYTLDQIKTL